MIFYLFLTLSLFHFAFSYFIIDHNTPIYGDGAYIRTDWNEWSDFYINLESITINGAPITSGINPFSTIVVRCTGIKYTYARFNSIGESVILPPQSCKWDYDGSMYEIVVYPPPKIGQVIRGNWGIDPKTCGEGHFLDPNYHYYASFSTSVNTTVCGSCSYKCLQCENSSKCSKCASGYFLSKTDYSCKSCSYHTPNCTSEEDNWVECPAGYSYNLKNRTCDFKCKPLCTSYIDGSNSSSLECPTDAKKKGYTCDCDRYSEYNSTIGKCDKVACVEGEYWYQDDKNFFPCKSPCTLCYINPALCYTCGSTYLWKNNDCFFLI